MEQAIREDIVKEADRLNQADLRRVLEFIRALNCSRPREVPGRELLGLWGTWEPEAAREVMAAIEEGCKQVDPDGW
jgi:hypothetical protein